MRSVVERARIASVRDATASNISAYAMIQVVIQSDSFDSKIKSFDMNTIQE